MNDVEWLEDTKDLKQQVIDAKIEAERYRQMASKFLTEMGRMKWELDLLKGIVKP
jgi:hypothetical protein